MRAVRAYLNHGYWKVDCPKCGTLGAVLAQEAPEISTHWTRGNRYVCPNCHPGTIASMQELHGIRVLNVPDLETRQAAQFAAEKSGDVYRVSFPRNKDEIERVTRDWKKPFVNWVHGQSIKSLLDSPQHNSYITPIVFVALQTLTAAQMNGIQANISEMGGLFSAAGNLSYAASTSTLGVLAKVVGGLLYFGASIPAWLSNVTGGILFGGATTPQYLAPGSTNSILYLTSTPAPAWATLATLIAGQAIVAAQSAGDWFYAASGTALAKLDGAVYGIPMNNAAGTGARIFTQNETTRAKRSTDLASTTNAETDIILNADDVDDGTWHSTVTNPTRITPTSAGRYETRALLEIENASGSNIDSVSVFIGLSTSEIIGACTIVDFVNGATLYVPVIGKTKDITAGQYFTLSTSRSNQSTGVTIKATNTWLQVERTR